MGKKGYLGAAPIVAWAAFGVIAAIFSFSIFGRWIFSAEHFSSIPISELDAMAEGDILKIRILEVISTGISLLALYFFLVRPWIRTRRAPITGLLVIGALTSYVIDTVVNYQGYFMAWNKHSINWGTWAAFFPFHNGPTRYAEALFWGPPMYLYFGVVLGLIQYKVMQVVQKRFNAPLMPALLVSMAVAFICDMIAEWSIIYFTQAYAWADTVKCLTLAPGSQFQFPLYESFLVALYGSLYASIIKSSRENEVSYIERGVDLLPGALRFPARLFAAIGFTFVPTMVYFGGFALISTFANSLADLPSYLMYVK